MTHVAGVGALIDSHDGFIIDQFGVLHDGVAAYPGAMECLANLAARGKPVVMLSNSGKRAAENAARVRDMGFPPGHVTAVVTSGEAAWLDLAEGPPGRRCVLVTRGGDLSIVAGSGVIVTEEVAEADFILVGGIDTPRVTLADYEALLVAGARRGLEMICANPDITAIVGDRLTDGPGALARRYEALGGRARWIGKPHPPIYVRALAALGGFAPARVLAIGDSIEHDIAGGAAAGCRTLLITGGIHAPAFVGVAAETALAALAREHGAMPDHWTERLVW